MPDLQDGETKEVKGSAAKPYVLKSFLEAIADDPDNDAPRLVYSDWLEERGDPRAEFIRVGCRKARTDPRDTAMIDLEYRERKLLAEHRASWIKALPLRVYNATFQRGLIHGVTVRADEFIKSGSELLAHAPIQEVKLTHLKDCVAELAKCKHLRRLKFLDLRDAKLGLARIKQLFASKLIDHLDGIDLSFNGLKYSGLRELCACDALSNVQRLRIDSCGVDEEGISLLLDSPISHGLTELTLRVNELSPTAIELLASAKHLSSLRTLDLSHNSSMTGEGMRRLMQSPNLAGLQHLSLRECWQTDGDVPAIAETDIAHDLLTLDLEFCLRVQTHAAHLAEAKCLEGLVSLSIAHCLIDTVAIRALIESDRLKHLRGLNLGGNRLDAAGARVLSDWRRGGHLTSLNVSGNELGDEGLATIATSPSFANLNELWLPDATDSTARTLAQSPHLNRLTSLELHPRWEWGRTDAPPAISDESKLMLFKRFGKHICRVRS